MITIAYISCRKEPLMGWFLDSLYNQWKGCGVDIEVLEISYHPLGGQPVGKYAGMRIIGCPLLPSWCQGEYKVTKDDYFSASIARNTAAVYAQGDYIAFVDDLSILAPTWLNSVLEGYRNREILLGTYRKDRNMVVENGLLISSEQDGHDSRFHRVRSANKVKAPYEFFYGCSFAMPTETFLELNGFDHLADYSGYEDCLFGHRLRKFGQPIYFDKNMLTIESQEHHFQEGNYFKRVDDEVSNEHYMAVLKDFGLKGSVYADNTRRDMSHAMLEVVRQCDGYLPRWNFYSLRDLRGKVQRGETITYEDMHYPERHWFYRKPLNEL